MAHINPAQKTSGQHPPLRVLLVDDNPLFLNRTSQWLNKQPGIHVVGQATSGKEGVELVLLLNPDLVVMDPAMPIMDYEWSRSGPADQAPIGGNQSDPDLDA